MKRWIQGAAGLALGGMIATGAAAQAPSADTLVVAQSADATTLDPADISARPAANVAQHIWGTLFQVTPAGEIVPYFAESASFSADGRELTVKIRPGLTCHDGEKLTAEDVAYSFKRAADPNLKFTGNTPGFVFSTIAFRDARVVDELTAVIVMGRYVPIALGMLGEVYIHCKDSYEKLSRDQAAQRPVGSGPYRFVEWVRDDRIVIERVEGYTLRAANFRRVVWRTIPEASTRAAELIAGNVDIITNLLPDQAAAVNRSPRAHSQAVAGTRRIYIGFNQGEAFGNTPGGLAIRKPEVRRALQHAVDVPTICETLLGTKCERATGLANPPNDNKSLKPLAYDPKLAEKMLDEAGYPRGAGGVRFELNLETPNGRYLNDVNVALAVGQFFGDVGVKVNVQPFEWSVYTPKIRQRNAGPLFLLGSGGSIWSALYDMADLSAVDAGTNYTRWADPEWFAGWDKIAATRDPAEQNRIKDEMLRVFYERSPWLLLYFQPDFYGVSNRIDWQARRDEKIYINEAKLK